MAKELKGGLPSLVKFWTSGHGCQRQNLYRMGECKGHSGDGGLASVSVEGKRVGLYQDAAPVLTNGWLRRSVTPRRRTWETFRG